MYLKPDRVEGLHGSFYYDPVRHLLIRTGVGHVGIPSEAYDRLVNRPIFDRAAFGVYFVADLDAFEPMYGSHSLRYAAIEAGLMVQEMEQTAPGVGLGLCQVGEMDFDPLRQAFELSERHAFVHSLLGGRTGK